MFLKTYPLTITTLSPVHIGCGEDMQPTNYFIEDNILHLFAIESLAECLDENDYQDLEKCMADKNSLLKIREFIFKNRQKIQKNYTYPIVTTAAIQKLYRDNLNQAVNTDNIINQLIIERSFFSANQQQPILPGSSIKGAIRTAVLDYLMEKQKDNKEIKEKTIQIREKVSQFNNLIEEHEINGEFYGFKLKPLPIEKKDYEDSINKLEKKLFFFEKDNHQNIKEDYKQKKENLQKIFKEIKDSLYIIDQENLNNLIKEFINHLKQKKYNNTDSLINCLNTISKNFSFSKIYQKKLEKIEGELKAYEEELLHFLLRDQIYNPNKNKLETFMSRDPFRLIKISDAGYQNQFSLTPSTIKYCVNRKAFDKKLKVSEQKLAIILEQVREFQVHSFKMECIMHQLPDIKDKEAVPDKDLHWSFQDIIKICNAFYWPKFIQDLQFIKSIHKENAWAEQIEVLLPFISEEIKKNQNLLLLRIGKHSGAESITLDEFSAIKIMLNKTDTQLWKFEDKTTTKWLAADSKEGENLIPYGWILVSLEDKNSKVYKELQEKINNIYQGYFQQEFQKQQEKQEKIKQKQLEEEKRLQEEQAKQQALEAMSPLEREFTTLIESKGKSKHTDSEKTSVIFQAWENNHWPEPEQKTEVALILKTRMINEKQWKTKPAKNHKENKKHLKTKKIMDFLGIDS